MVRKNPTASATSVFLALLSVAAAGPWLVSAGPPATGMLDESAEKARAADVIGPEGGDNSCVNCHALETEAWKETTHFTTYVQRHQSPEAKTILANMGITSMKRSSECRQCHYTSILANDNIRPQWGVSCESCHSPAKAWNDIHNKAAGDPNGKTMKWGEGKSESAEARAARLAAAAAQGMLHPEKLYDIATNCFGCHTVPNEKLVNQGKHKAGSDHDLVAWSQGEVRHNFLSSGGAPASPANRPATEEEKRRLYVVGALVDLEVSLRNLAGVKEKGGDFHKAMLERVRRGRAKVDAILAAVKIPAIGAVVAEVPKSLDENTRIGADLPQRLGTASKQLSANPPNLDAVGGLLPTTVKGKPYGS